MNTTDFIQKAFQTHTLTVQELTAILEDDGNKECLFKAADQTRQAYVGDAIHLRALVEFTNICRNNCLYCGLRCENQAVPRFRLTPEEILSLARNAKSYDYKTLVLQGGEDPFFTAPKLAEIVREIHKLGLALTLSVGEFSYEDYKLLKEAGADRYLLRIETADKILYEKLNPGMSFENRIRCLRDLKRLGFETGTGILTGLPGQTLASLARDILFFKEMDADMIGLGPFIPNPQTPLKNAATARLNTSLKVVALTRLLLPDINIPATTAMETIEPDGRLKALQCGANVVMPNIAEGEYKKFYALYPGKFSPEQAPLEYKEYLRKQFTAIGRTISKEFGFRKKAQ